jgi:hypothetical protein
MMRRTTRPILYLLMTAALSVSHSPSFHVVLPPMLKMKLYVVSILISVALFIESAPPGKKNGQRTIVLMAVDTIGVVSLLIIVTAGSMNGKPQAAA